MDAAAWKGRIDFGIISILNAEFEAVLQRFPPERHVVGKSQRRYALSSVETKSGGRYDVALVRCIEQGNSEAQSVARDLLEDLEPRWLLVVGIAGGVPADEFTLGDVIVSTRVYDFSVEALDRDGVREFSTTGGPMQKGVAALLADLPASKKALGEWNGRASLGLARPQVDLAPKNFYGSAAWKRKARASLERHFGEQAKKRAPLVMDGFVGSSDRLVKNEDVLKAMLKGARKILAVEMEAAGVFRAASERGVPFLAIRGLSDIVGFKRHPDWTEYACHTAAAFALAFLRMQPIEPAAAAPPLSPPLAAADKPVAAHLPSCPPCFGRDRLIAELVDALLSEPPPPVPILGPAGMGKSNLTLRALHHPKVAERYGPRRWFVRVDPAESAEAVVGLLAAALGVAPRGDRLADVRAELSREKGVLSLDNFETPWERDRKATEELLALLAAIPGLAIVVSVRGAKRPAGVAFRESIEVTTLDEAAAAELFCSIAGAKHRREPGLAALLARMGGVPLAITLLAPAAEGNDLKNLAEEWSTKRTALLQKEGVTPGRLSSWAVSLECSIGSSRMTPEAKQLATLLSALPDGIAQQDLDALLPGMGPKSARVLSQVGLAFFEGGRLGMLAPIRQYLADVHPADTADLDRAMEHYGKLARTLGPKPGGVGGAEAVGRLAPETANLDAMIQRGLATTRPRRWIDTAIALQDFARFSGRGGPSLIELAREAAHQAGETKREAKCLRGLGDFALDRSNHKEARRRYEQAMPLYAEVGDVLGQANCIQRLGDIELDRANHKEARRLYEQAMPLYAQVASVQGQANCIQRLGDLALLSSNHEDARRLYEQAMPLYAQVASVQGQAKCIQRLGDLALLCSNHEEAQILYEQAKPLYEQVGDVQGQANCIRSLGDIALLSSNHDKARRQFEAALLLYGRIPEPYSMGMTHRRLAKLATDPATKERHVEAARAAWSSIDRPDLVARLEQAFGVQRS